MEEKKAYEQEAESQAEEVKDAKRASDEAGQAEVSSDEMTADAAGQADDSSGKAAPDAAGSETDQADGASSGREGSEGENSTGTDAESDADAAGKDSESQSAKSGFFRKKEKKDKKDEKIEELNDRVRRQMAEFDNFRKRTEKEKSQMFETGAKSIIEKILPVIDNFERGLAALSDEEKDTPFADGMEKVYKQMMTVLAEAGVKVIETKGKEFDPNFHNAVMHIDDENFGENIIAEEFQKGYTYRDSVVRHSMVKVAN
ncbi:MAG: nucleotide exchange factor GrpE [Clostridiales bacterium]|nr:nucleotide exchange factor GrpE [Clostridiales bacterium]